MNINIETVVSIVEGMVYQQTVFIFIYFQLMLSSVDHTFIISIDNAQRTNTGSLSSVSYTHLTLPTNREV